MAAYNTKDENSSNWSSTFIVSLWSFIRQMWKYRNGVLHGKITKEAANILLMDN
jgi:hypothetical protein